MQMTSFCLFTLETRYRGKSANQSNKPVPLVSQSMQKKKKVLTNNNLTQQPIVINNHRLEYVNKFTYLGSIISLQGGAEEDIKALFGKARSAFANLQLLWRSSIYSQKTKLRIYQSNVLSVFLYDIRMLAHDTTRQ